MPVAAINEVQLAIVIALFLLVTGLGFAAARWRRAESLDNVEEWGLGGRKFGGWITWFLLGGDIYTAYTFVAVPALVFGLGAIGFFAVPYTIIVYPMVLLAAIRLWSVAHRHGFVTPADFVRARYGSSLARARDRGHRNRRDDALHRAAARRHRGGREDDRARRATCRSSSPLRCSPPTPTHPGLRAPALIAFVKDSLIYIVVIVAIIVIPINLGGFDDIFARGVGEVLIARGPERRPRARRRCGARLLDARVRLGARPVPLPAHDDRVLAARSRNTIKRNMVALPAYTLVLGLLALLGYMAIAAGITADRRRPQHDRPAAVRRPVPGLVRRNRPRGDRDRRPRAGRDHGDRGGEPVRPQHLQGVPATATRHWSRRRGSRG